MSGAIFFINVGLIKKVQGKHFCNKTKRSVLFFVDKHGTLKR